MAWTLASGEIMVSVGHAVNDRRDNRRFVRRQWGEPAVVEGTHADSSPSLVIHDRVALLVWHSRDGAHLCRGTVREGGSAVSWEEPQDLEQLTDGPPALAVSDDGTFGMAWGSPQARQAIWMTTSRNGKEWATPYELRLDGSAKSDDGLQASIVNGPALGSIEGRWHLAWHADEPDNYVWVAVSGEDRYDAWLPPVPLVDRPTTAPAGAMIPPPFLALRGRAGLVRTRHGERSLPARPGCGTGGIGLHRSRALRVRGR